MVKTDNTAMSHFLTQPNLMPKLGYWKELLAKFDF